MEAGPNPGLREAVSNTTQARDSVDASLSVCPNVSAFKSEEFLAGPLCLVRTEIPSVGYLSSLAPTTRSTKFLVSKLVLMIGLSTGASLSLDYLIHILIRT